MSISVLAELDRIGWAYEFRGDDEVAVCCPFHDDESPSASINTVDLVFKCHTAGCREQGDFVKFLCGALKTVRTVVWAELSTRYVLDETKTIDPDFIERCHTAIWKAGPLLLELRKRGVTDALIRKYRLGEHKGRVTIPIKNDAGQWVNLRKYLPGAPGKEKMKNTKGFSRIRLYPFDQLAYDELILCGGEMKAIVAADQVNRYNIGAVTHTGGEGNWDPSLSQHFAGKKIYIIGDIDEEGQHAAKDWCIRLFHVARWVGNGRLPLDIERYPHGDINDFVASENGSLKRFVNGIERFTLDVSRPGSLVDEDPIDSDLHNAVHADKTGKRLKWTAVVTAAGDAPYSIPSKVQIRCDRNQQCCAMCPVFISHLEQMSIHPESQAILELVGSKRTGQQEALKHGLGIPKPCRVVEFDPLGFYNVEDIRISPQLEITNRSADRVMQPAVCIGDGVELNESFEMIGRMHPHPNTQQATLVVSDYKPCLDNLSTYVPSNTDKLKTFQPDAWDDTALIDRLRRIYDDLSANVTRIFRRRDLHLAVDVAYHSPLLFNFDGKIEKGWTEVLVMGDTAQGKSETALGLQKFYRLGEMIECKNATVAGLLGGLQQLGGKWFVTWGVIPTHDKRLVILEELKGCPVEVFARLTAMRSSGIAEIPKIEKRRTNARTRLLALSNPRSRYKMDTYNFGIDAIRELIGNPEDIRRFDLSLIVADSELEAGELEHLQQHRPTVKHVYTSDLCSELILWVWTRTHEQVVFENQSLILSEAATLCEQFTDAIPVVDKGSMRFKLARVAAALAGRTFSTDDGKTLVVRNCHVKFAVSTFNRIYESKTFGYKEFTDAYRRLHTLTDEDKIKGAINDAPFPKDLAESMLHTPSIELLDIQDWCSWDRTAATQLMSLLVRKGAMRRTGRSYRKSAPFIELLKTMLSNGQLVERPDFIDEVDF